ncbi:MAG: hypothetical protein V7742_21225 [Halioglobus sp.]
MAFEEGGWFTSSCEEEPDEHNQWSDDLMGDVPGNDEDDDAEGDE